MKLKAYWLIKVYIARVLFSIQSKPTPEKRAAVAMRMKYADIRSLLPAEAVCDDGRSAWPRNLSPAGFCVMKLGSRAAESSSHQKVAGAARRYIEWAQQIRRQLNKAQRVQFPSSFIWYSTMNNRLKRPRAVQCNDPFVYSVVDDKNKEANLTGVRQQPS